MCTDGSLLYSLFLAQSSLSFSNLPLPLTLSLLTPLHKPHVHQSPRHKSQAVLMESSQRTLTSQPPSTNQIPSSSCHGNIWLSSELCPVVLFFQMQVSSDLPTFEEWTGDMQRGHMVYIITLNYIFSNVQA